MPLAGPGLARAGRQQRDDDQFTPATARARLGPGPRRCCSRRPARRAIANHGQSPPPAPLPAPAAPSTQPAPRRNRRCRPRPPPASPSCRRADRGGREGAPASRRAGGGAGQAAHRRREHPRPTPPTSPSSCGPQLAAVRSQIEKLGPPPAKDAPARGAGDCRRARAAHGARGRARRRHQVHRADLGARAPADRAHHGAAALAVHAEPDGAAAEPAAAGIWRDLVQRDARRSGIASTISATIGCAGRAASISQLWLLLAAALLLSCRPAGRRRPPDRPAHA